MVITMSRIGDLISGILGKEEKTEETAERPCRNCLPSCPYAPGACEECQPCKERLLDCIWNAEHEEEYLARYEIVPETDQAVGTETCPFCGGQNPVTAEVCDYCGSQLREPSGKIRVKSAAEIPSPILAAQDVIFERQAILKRYLSETQKESAGLLDALHDLLTGTEDDGVSLGGNIPLDGKMTEEEIRAVAAAYGVSVGSYLQGLDNGIYLTASAKQKDNEKKAAAEAASAAAASAAAASAAVPQASMGYAVHPVRPGEKHPGPKHPGQVHPGQGRPGQVHPGQERPGQGRPGQGRPGQGRPVHPVQPVHSPNAMHSANAMHPGRPSAAKPQQMHGKGPGRNARGGNRGGGSHR